MSESVSLHADELPEIAELALLVRAVGRILPLIPWGVKGVEMKLDDPGQAGAATDNLPIALLSTTLLSLHCVEPGSVEVEATQLYRDLSLISPENSAQSLLFDVLRRLVGFAAGVESGVPGEGEAQTLAQIASLGSVAESSGATALAEHAYMEDRALISMEGQTLADADAEYRRALIGGRLWGAELDTEAMLGEPLKRWHKALTASGLSWMWGIYGGWLRGDSIDWQRLERYVHDWYESRLLDKVGQQDAAASPTKGVAGGDPALEVKGGIATASEDEPSATDRLGRRPLVNTLADMLASPEQPLPMTIALLGAWGAGKSSVILQLRQRLTEFKRRDDRAHYRFAEFNAWEYEQTDNLRAGLAHEVIRGLTADMNGWQKMRLALNNACRQHGMELLGLLAALLLAGAALWLGLATTRGATGAAAQAGGVGAIGFSAWLLVNAYRNARKMLAHPLASQLKTYLQLPAYGKHLGEVPVIREEIGGLCAARLGVQKPGQVEHRLLVVVDDLDRCQPECITACLDAVRLVMSLPHVAVIIAVDDRIAFQAVAAHYAGLAKDGSRSKEAIARDYLGKIIQLPVNLYQPWPQEVAAFVSEHLFKVDASEGTDGSDERAAQGGEQANQTNGQPEYGVAVGGAGTEPRRGIEQGQSGALDKVVDGNDSANSISDASGATGAASEHSQPTQPNTSDLQGESEQQSRMRDHRFEQELFIELAGLAQFSNPRQLIRLRNGYRLLKGYTLNRRGDRGMARQDCERLLLGLFWYEYLYQREVSERREQELLAWEWFEPLGLDDAAKSRADDRRLRAAESSQAMVQRLAQCLGEPDWYDNYPNMLRTVQMAVLPNADLGLLLTSAEASAAAGDQDKL